MDGASSQQPSVKSVAVGAPGGPSSLDAWQGWPENCRNFDPVHGPRRTREIREYFCADHGCIECTRPEVVHVAEYDAKGKCLLDRTLNTPDLQQHLRNITAKDAAIAKDSVPKFRIFFCCAHYAWYTLKTPYMRSLLSFCQAPVGVGSSFGNHWYSSGFQTYTDTVRQDPDQTARTVLHYWLSLPLFEGQQFIVSHKDLYAPPLRDDLLAQVSKGFETIYLQSAIYVSYDDFSDNCNIVLCGPANIFFALHNVCRNFTLTHVNEDPFVIAVHFIEESLFVAGLYAKQASRQAEWFHEQTDPFGILDRANRDRGVFARTSTTTAAIARAIDQVRDAHQQFLMTRTVDATVIEHVNSSLDRQKRLALELVEVLRFSERTTQSKLDGIIGASQLRNGVNMYKIAQDNQKQAEATEFIARDAKRDSEIMKTITVVTLIYLPATFVCTLLSMGLFDFDVGGSGKLTVARQGWIFLAITIPLTVTTLALAYAWQYYRERLVVREVAAEDAAEESGEGHVARDEHKGTSGWRTRSGFGLRRRRHPATQ